MAAAVQLPRPTLRALVARALEEDLGPGDITTSACIERSAQGRAEMRARERLVLCGVGLVREVYAQLDPGVEVIQTHPDGGVLQPGQSALTVSGPSAAILEGERVALNFVQRMSAIATRTRAFVDALPSGSSTRITDTRKTTPGLRVLERYAVRCGGGHNHRDNLAAAVLIKDNHIAACGGVRRAIERARAFAPHTSRITCEVGDRDELREALEARADVVMLDNFADDDLPQAVAQVGGRALIEVSGRITLDRVPVIARAGVDVISVGGITHSAASVDLGLDWLDAS
jgi:nicotinate-nucleotide pyrophosphorylase (carboxylating)